MRFFLVAVAIVVVGLAIPGIPMFVHANPTTVRSIEGQFVLSDFVRRSDGGVRSAWITGPTFKSRVSGHFLVRHGLMQFIPPTAKEGTGPVSLSCKGELATFYVGPADFLSLKCNRRDEAG